ncbi:MAG: TIM barrel protein [Candidatus Solibacter usitatus]|nr:TIM barrel protein [Candidatus Solibacter usitatus]
MISRRLFCSLPAAAVASAAQNWEERLAVMCQLGSSEANARKVLDAAREAGFRRVMVNFAWDRVDDAFLSGLPGWLRAAGLRSEALGAYVNCAAPDQVLMSTRARDFARAIVYAAGLGCRRLVAWTGSHTAELMKADARNFTRESEDAIVRFLEPYYERLEQNRLTLALETYVTLVCPDARALRRVLDRLPRTVTAVMDPPNLTAPARFPQRDEALREMFRALEGRVGVVHLKDFRLAADGQTYELPGPLAGAMNYRLYAELIRTLPADVPVVAEHIGPEEFASTRRKLLAIFNAR